MSLLIDTHIWLWLMTGDAKFSKSKAAKRFDQVASTQGYLISIISVWEVSMLANKGRIRLALPISQWVEQALKAPGSHLQPITPTIAVQSTVFGDDFHPDPVDRLLVATAMVLGAELMTADEKILAYARVNRNLKVIAV